MSRPRTVCCLMAAETVIDASGELTSDRTNLEAVVAPAEVEAVGTLDIEVVATASRG